MRNGKAGERAAVDLDRVLAPHRAAVLQFIGRLSLVGGVPLLALLVVLAAGMGNPVWFLLVELGCVVTIALGLREVDADRLVRPCLIFLTGFGTMCLLALNGFGPLFGAGMMVVAWLLAAVFFTGQIWLPAAVTVVGVGAVGVLGWLDLTTAPWPNDPGFLVRELLTAAIVSSASAYLFHRIFVGLGAAIANEAEARRREAQAQREREASLEALAEAKRLESIGRLAGGVAHDVNNALTVLLGGIEVMDLDVVDREHREILHDMRAASEGAMATTRQLLAFARARGPEAGVCADPAGALRSLGRNLERLLPETVELVLEVQPDLPPVATSSGDFEQLVLNLCLNGRDAMPEGGRLTLRCALEDDGAALGRHLCVEVRDEGIGMDEATRARVFEPFFSTKHEAGNGLGLSMVHGAVRAAGGRIDLDSTPGAGTRVWARLPLAGDAIVPTEPRRVARARATAAGRPARVLLVEDEPGVRRSLSRVLRAAGFEVTAVESVAAALARIGAETHDALVTDGLLPDGDASPVLAAFEARGGGARLVVSGHLGEGDLRARIERDGVPFLRKPVASEALVELLNEQLQMDKSAGPSDRVG